MKRFFAALSLVGAQLAYGQQADDSLILAALTFNSALVVKAQPLTKIPLKKSEMDNYAYAYRGYGVGKLDTNAVLEIIDNSTSMDCSQWKQAELPTAILVATRDEKIKYEDALTKWRFRQKTTIRETKRLVREFNATDSSDRNICYMSRPVYNRAHTVAVVARSNGHGLLGGGGAVELFELVGSIWVYKAPVDAWAY